MLRFESTIPDRLFLAVISLGLLARIVWSLFVPVEPVSGPAAYDALARTIAEHGVYGWTASEPTAFWAVGTSAVVAATYLAGVSGYAGVVALNLVAALVSMLLIWRLGEVWFDRPTALCATALFAAWPNLIFFTSIISSELYFIALTLLGLWFWERREGSFALNIAMSGLAFGLACYIRPLILLLPLVLVLASLPHGMAQTRRAALKALVATLIIVIVVSPWTYRNMQLFGRPVLVSTNFGPTLWMGNNPDTTGTYMSPPKWAEQLPELERSDKLGQAAKDYILSDIPGFVTRTLRKLVYLHAGETIGVTWNAAAIERGLGSSGVIALMVLSTGYWFAILAMALGGILLFFRQSAVAAMFHPAVISWAYFAAIPAVIVADQRYHMPATPFIALLAAVLLAKGLQSERAVSFVSRRSRGQHKGAQT